MMLFILTLFILHVFFFHNILNQFSKLKNIVRKFVFLLLFSIFASFFYPESSLT